LGVVYAARAELLYALRMHLPAITMQYGAGSVYAEYAAGYQNSKLSLVRSAAGDVAQRVWETAAMGCLVVMDDCPDSAALGLVDGENCLIYRTLEEAVDKVRWALEHPEEAAAMAQVGQLWAQDGTWDKRLQVILDWASGMETKPAKARKRQKAVNEDDR
jgi:hypothetical protein